VKSEGKTQNPSRTRGERIAGLIVLVIGIPLVMSFTRAIADGEQQRRETPLRAVLGDEAFERLERGEKTEVSYLGNDRLAPDFSLLDQTGKPWKLSQHRGKTVVMNFWSITCQPCVEEMPSLIELAEIASRRDDIELVTVSTDANWQAVSALFPPSSKLKVLFDPDKKIVRGKYGTRLYPETWVVDPKGVIRMRIDGAREWSSPLMIDAISASQI
jgi:peroxiredoxin